jgi:hypothetical protein
MISKKELQFATGLAAVLLFVGVICYAALPPKAPEEPIRIMFMSTAGKVLFDHKTHTAETGYGYACNDCHHHPSDGEALACGDCHLKTEEELAPVCLECHEADEVEAAIKRGDSFHNQCIGCHNEIGAGPMECSDCHIM